MKAVYLGAVFLILACSGYTPQHLYDKNFIMLSDQHAPDNSHRMITYYFDTGAFGYSRVFWAVIPTTADTTKLNLTKFLLPDGYKAKNWLPTGEAVIEKWKPYYYKDKEIDLKTGDVYLGVKLVVE